MRYQHKPTVVEAVQWTGDNLEELQKFVPPEYRHNKIHEPMGLITNNGVVTIHKNDYIIKGALGEFYPCSPIIFELNYEVFKEKQNDLLTAVQDLERFANQLRMMEDPSQIEDGVYVADCVVELYDIVKRNQL